MEKVSRRQFIQSAIGGSVAISGILADTRAQGQSENPLKMGVIGCGWYGMVDVQAAFKVGGVEIVAICDVDSQHLEDSATKIEALQGSRPQLFKDYKELLAVSGLQAVIIATPPHWHALPFLAALDRGLDIYCEKPLAYDIREGQAMAAAAGKTDRIVQIGFQRRQSPAIRQARDYVQQGRLGRIINGDVHIHYKAGMRDTTPQAPPASLDWNQWCGPAPKLPYSPQVGHFAWRLEKAYGNGHLVDWGIHLMDATRWILNETMPLTVQASGGIYYFKDKITTPDILTAHFEFETCPVIWQHRMWGAKEYAPEIANGILLYGEKGTLFVTDSQWIVIPKDKGERQVNKVKADMGKAHMAGFLEAVRTRQQPLCPPNEAYQSTSTVQLAMIAYELGRKIQWDAETQQIAGNRRARAMMKRDYRAPWQHPYQG
ncbi:MAG: Gfo/Idh/MocA family oxidoreductase [Phycisphaeraceae bacterium]|nr:Gfo/Idh/MocA family oxidoreductase [Phycisphaeraceae bacterium]